MGDREIAECLYERLRAECRGDETMGELETLVDRGTREARRLVLERLTRDAAVRQKLGCPQCGSAMRVVNRSRPRTVESAVGAVRFARDYGRCPDCGTHAYPADEALGLHGAAHASPRLQELCALTALRAPAGRAEEDVRRLAGRDVAASTLHREARRQGGRALAIRGRDAALSETPEGRACLAARAPVLPEHSTLIIEIDAWNIRERDCWGETRERREAGEDVGRWHWVYTATVFRLDQRGTTAGDRSVVADRGYVATRAGLADFRRQLYAEALQRGLLQAETTLVLGDGAAWIWNLAGDQFPQARQRVDQFHVSEHLWGLAAELHGRGTPEAAAWVRPHLSWLERRKDGALDVIGSLEELEAVLAGTAREAVAREIGYLREHQDRMDYKAAKALGQPCGSGAIESTCSQYQRRFKLTGQFWSLQGDEELLALDTLHRNGRWHLLFPHDMA